MVIRFLRFALIPLICLLAMELCARLEDKIRYEAPFWSNYDEDGLYTYDVMGKTGKPNASYLKWKLNAAGFRGPQLRTGTCRIVTLGASETFGLYERENGEWPRQLERELNARAGTTGFEVVNAAYPGMSFHTIALRSLTTARLLHPEVVVVYPSFAPYIEQAHADRTASLKPPSNGPRLRLATRVDSLLKQSLPDKLQTYLRELAIRRDLGHRVAMARLPEADVQRFRSDLEDLVGALHSQHVTVIFVTHATRFNHPLRQSERKYLVLWRKFYPDLSEEGFLDMEDRMNDTMRSVGARDGVSVVDAAREILPGDDNFQDFIHFTDQGARAMAVLIANKLLPSTDAPMGCGLAKLSRAQKSGQMVLCR